MKLVTVAEMVAIEREADKAGLSYEAMMENAGRGLANIVAEFDAPEDQGSILGLVGSGNNGGDTLVALGHLAEVYGWKIAAYIVKDRPEDDPLVARVEQLGGKVLRHRSKDDFTSLREVLLDCDLVLDGLLGTGIRLPLRGDISGVLDYCREILSSLESPPGIIAVDCPSGMDCDSGKAASEVLKADMTVTMAAVKLGMLRFPAFGLIGALRIVDIGLPDGLKSWQKIRREVVDAERVRGLLPERPLDSHKGTFGTVMVVGGSVNYTGAPLMAGKAAYRGGAGLVSLAVPTSLHGPLAGVFPEAVWLLLPDEMGVIGSAAAALIRRNLDSVTALAVGPGLGQESSTQDFLRLLFREHSGPARRKIGFVPNSAEKEDDPEDNSDKFPPVILDADGLKLLARIPSWEDRLPGLAVLTPHPGEMSILTGLEIAEIQANRLETAEKYSLKWGHVVVLKGAGTIIAAPDGNTGIIPIATPALARAGTGDILTGLIAGLRAQGLGAYEAAIAGAWIHAEAGLMAAEFSGTDISILAGDILETIQDVLAFCQNTP